jgi:hypothetical protein
MFLYPMVLFGVGMGHPPRSVTFGPRQRPSAFSSAQHSLLAARQALFTLVYVIPHAVAAFPTGYWYCGGDKGECEDNKGGVHVWTLPE